MTQIKYSGPVMPEGTPWQITRQFQLIHEKLANHTQAFSIQKGIIDSITAGNSVTNITETVGGGSSPTPASSSSITVNNQSGQTSYSTVSGDNMALIVLSDASAIALTLTSQTPPWACLVANQGSGTTTVTPASGTISYAGNTGAASMPLLGGYCAILVFDGADWWAYTEPIVPVSFGAISHEFLTAYDAATGSFSSAQPAFSDLSGAAASSQLPIATTSSVGAVKPDGTSITIDSAGAISASAGGAGVSSLDGITGPITLRPGTGITITDNTPAAGDIQISASGGAVPLAISASPDWPPSSPSAYDDEFTGSSLNTTLWSHIINGVPNTLQVSQSNLGIICGPHSGDDFTTVCQPIPSSTPYTLTAKVKITGFNYNFFYGGICIQDTSGKSVVWQMGNGLNISVHHWNSNTSYNSAPLTWSTGFQASYLRITDDGTNLNFYVSLEGSAWTTVYQESRTAFLSAPAYMGFMCGSNDGTHPVTLESDWFRVT